MGWQIICTKEFKVMEIVMGNMYHWKGMLNVNYFDIPSFLHLIDSYKKRI